MKTRWLLVVLCGLFWGTLVSRNVDSAGPPGDGETFAGLLGPVGAPAGAPVVQMLRIDSSGVYFGVSKRGFRKHPPAGGHRGGFSPLLEEMGPGGEVRAARKGVWGRGKDA